MAVCTNCGLESPEEFRFCPSCGTRRVTDGGSSDPLVDRTLGGKYRVVERIGAGSMGAVYRAEHIALKKPIAIKVLRRDLEVGDDALHRFQREGIAAGQISHPNVIQIFDFDRSDDGLVYLAMEFVDGISLKAWLTQNGKLTPASALDLSRQLLGTLDEAHRHGIVHRDLKPENLMVVEGQRGTRSLKVLDFGLSKLVDRPLDVSQQTIPGRVLGTPLYMAPEQWRGDEVDHRTDLYAATLVLYEMLTGEPPFRGRDVTETMAKTTSEPPPSLLDTDLDAAIPDALDDIVQTGLAKRPEDRFQSAAEMLEALEAVDLEATGTGRERRPRRRTPARAPSRRSGPSMLPKVLAGVAVVAVIAVAYVVFSSGGSQAGVSPLLSARPKAALSPDEQTYVATLDAARARLVEGDADAALGAVDTALAMACVDAEAFALRAAIRRKSGDLDAALADYRTALERYPDYAYAAAGIGWVNFLRGDFKAAKLDFAGALEINGDTPDAIAGQAALLYQAGDYAQADTMLDRAAASHPQNALVQLWRGRAKLARGNAEGAITSFRRAKSADAGLFAADEGLGDALLARGDVDQATFAYREALAGGGESVELRRKLVVALVQQGDFEAALPVVRAALEAHPNHGELQLLAGIVEQGRGNVAGAIHALEQTIASDDDRERAQVLDLLAALELQRGNDQRAIAHCEAAAAEAESPTVFASWGLALFRTGDYPGAASKLERAIDLGSDDPFVLYSLGVIQMDYLGDAERAVESFEAYRRNGGTDERVDGWIRRLRG